MNHADPVVSVLITAYNREKYIGEAIESVLRSSFQNFEIIVVDDRSKDGTYEVVETYTKLDARIRLYRNEQNLGDYANRNQAASYAKGRYLKYIDADDKIYPLGLEIMVSNMNDFPEAGWGVGSLRQDDDRIFPFVLQPKEAYIRNYLNTNPRVHSRKIFSKAPLSVIIRKEVFEAVGGFNNVRHYGDGDLWNRLGRKYPVVLMQDGLVWWRGHADQENKKRKDNFIASIRTWNNMIEHLTHPECPLPKDQTKALVNRYRKWQLGLFAERLRRFRINDAKAIYKEIGKPST